MDPSNPASFFEAMGQHGLPTPSSFPKPKEVKQKSRQLAKEIFDKYYFLHDILERHEETIQKRWRKKTMEQRRKILLAAWPDMSKGHRPDFEAFIRESPQRRAQGTKFREAFMWPHINLEDLLRPKFLLLFLKSRGRSLPDAFAFADYDAIHIGQITGAIRPSFLNLYTMVFTDRKTPQSYGQLISWDDHPDAFEWMNSGIGKHPGEGLIILEVQQRVWSFLVECCLQILHELPKEDIVGARYAIKPEPAMVLGRDETGFPSLTVVAAEAPYRVPTSLDLARLENIIASKRAAAEDHIWALREDPGYFAQVLLDFKEHRQELIPDTNGDSHPTLNEPSQSMFWNRVLGEAVSTSYFDLLLWDNIHRQILRLIELRSQHERAISPLEQLPADYLLGLQSFHYFLKALSKSPIELLKRGVPASPPMRQHFVREPQRPGTTMMQVQSRPATDGNKIRGRLLWLFSTLWDPEQLFLLGLHNLVDELERLTQSEPEAKRLLSSWTAARIFDLSLMAECIQAIEHYYPWGVSIQDEAANESLKEEYISFSQRLRPLLTTKFEGTSLADLGAPTSNRFFYPVEKRRTKSNTQVLRSSEENLDIFWRAADQLLISKSKSTYDMVHKLLTRDRILQRTPEWMEPTKEDPRPANNAQSLCQPLSQLHLDLESRTERTVSRNETAPATAKSKTKTRKAPDAPEGTSQSNQIPLSPPFPVAIPRFPVDRRALKVMSTLFHIPSSSSQPGEIGWTDFLHAMVSAGLSPQKLYGSVWQFSPSEGRSIQFHEPHPVGKVPFWTARRHGRRLNRAYGWEGSSFVLKEAPTEE